MQQKRNTILIIDSDPQFQKFMSAALHPDSFGIVECRIGKEATRPGILTGIDLVLLDLSLTDIEGKAVITALRKHSQVPIIIVSGRGSDEDVIAALNMGVDDYITKPFNPKVLLARMYTTLRKAAVREADVPEIKNGPLRMDLVRHKVFLNDEPVSFTPKEYNLLRYFIIHRGKMLPHGQILQDVWGVAHREDMQYLRVYVGQLRAKIQQHSSMPALIVTEPGVGYRMEVRENVAPNQARQLRNRAGQTHPSNGLAKAEEART